MSEASSPGYTKTQAQVRCSARVGGKLQSWQLNCLVTATVVGHYLPTAAGATQDRARWDGTLTVLGIKLADIQLPGTEVLPTEVDFDHEHKEYWGFQAKDWAETSEGVIAHVNHTGKEFFSDATDGQL